MSVKSSDPAAIKARIAHETDRDISDDPGVKADE